MPEYSALSNDLSMAVFNWCSNRTLNDGCAWIACSGSNISRRTPLVKWILSPRVNNLNLRCTTLCLPSGIGTLGSFQEVV